MSQITSLVGFAGGRFPVAIQALASFTWLHLEQVFEVVRPLVVTRLPKCRWCGLLWWSPGHGLQSTRRFDVLFCDNSRTVANLLGHAEAVSIMLDEITGPVARSQAPLCSAVPVAQTREMSLRDLTSHRCQLWHRCTSNMASNHCQMVEGKVTFVEALCFGTA